MQKVCEPYTILFIMEYYKTLAKDWNKSIALENNVANPSKFSKDAQCLGNITQLPSDKIQAMIGDYSLIESTKSNAEAIMSGKFVKIATVADVNGFKFHDVMLHNVRAEDETGKWIWNEQTRSYETKDVRAFVVCVEVIAVKSETGFDMMSNIDEDLMQYTCLIFKNNNKGTTLMEMINDLGSGQKVSTIGSVLNKILKETTQELKIDKKWLNKEKGFNNQLIFNYLSSDDCQLYFGHLMGRNGIRTVSANYLPKAVESKKRREQNRLRREENTRLDKQAVIAQADTDIPEGAM